MRNDEGKQQVVEEGLVIGHQDGGAILGDVFEPLHLGPIHQPKERAEQHVFHEPPVHGNHPSLRPLHRASRYLLYRLSGRLRKGKPEDMAAFGLLEWTFVGVLVALVGAAGLFALFLLLQLFRNPSRRH